MGRPKKILVTGAGGLLGSEFAELGQKNNYPEFEIIPKTHRELDITDWKQVETALSNMRPDYLINCAAYTDVDGAEKERDLAQQVNVEGVRILAEYCKKNEIKLVHFSTDNIFNGQKPTPYIESDIPDPINFYGRTKFEGEKILRIILAESNYLILRITWPYGKKGRNFINKALHQLLNQPKSPTEWRVVTDQIGTPTPANWIAFQALKMLDNTSGIFNLSCRGFCSKYEFITFLSTTLKRPCRILPALSDQFPSPAKRPKNSALDSERKDLLDHLEIPSWQEALRQYISQSSFS